MTDDLTPLQSRITKIVGDEERLNQNRKSALGARQAHRDAEKRTEAASLATLQSEKEHQMGVNAAKEHTYQEALRREGEELMNVSKEIRNDYATEVQRRKVAEEQLRGKVAALETRLRNVKAARPS